MTAATAAANPTLITRSTPTMTLNDGDSRKAAWDSSYSNRDNFLFHPHEEVIRFVSKYIRKRIGLAQYLDIATTAHQPARVLDLGCGIGRHVMYCHDMGLDAYGIDLSDTAISVAHQWARERDCAALVPRIVQGSVAALPWDDGFMTFAVSHGVLDSMPFETAREACVELARVLAPGGLFYCDLISGDDSHHSREFYGEEEVSSQHETGTIQLYFNVEFLRSLFQGLFEIVECHLVRKENVFQGGHASRYHLVVRKP